MEIDRAYLKEHYKGNVSEYIRQERGFAFHWTEEKIKRAFNFGNGTMKDFKRFIHNNKKYSYFVEI